MPSLFSKERFLSASSVPGCSAIALVQTLKRKHLIGSYTGEVWSSFIIANIPLPPAPAAGTSEKQLVEEEARNEGQSLSGARKLRPQPLHCFLCAFGMESEQLAIPLPWGSFISWALLMSLSVAGDSCSSLTPQSKHKIIMFNALTVRVMSTVRKFDWLGEKKKKTKTNQTKNQNNSNNKTGG